MLKNLPYDPVRDFAPVSLLGTSPYILVVNSNVPVNSTAELVAYAKAQPGKLNFGTYGSGSSNHLATELFRSMTGVDVVHVPYKGAARRLLARAGPWKDQPAVGNQSRDWALGPIERRHWLNSSGL